MGSAEREPSNVAVEQVLPDATNACLRVLERAIALLAEAGASRQAPAEDADKPD